MPRPFRLSLRVSIAAGLCLAPFLSSEAQLVTVGAGALLSERPTEPVFELHVASPPVFRSRAYVTASWSDDGARPTLITAAERSMLNRRRVALGLGAGALWLDANDYEPYPILVGSSVVRLPVARTSVVAIASTQPFQEFDWSVVLKVAVAVWFAR